MLTALLLYLQDLDYTYSRAGDLPKYLPTLAFPPSYFHRVIRTMGSGNPICHIDIAPWGEEIAANLQLLQDRMKMETYVLPHLPSLISPMFSAP